MINKALIKQVKKAVFGSERPRPTANNFDRLYSFNLSQCNQLSAEGMLLVQAMKNIPQYEWEATGLGNASIIMHTVHALPLIINADYFEMLDGAGNTLLCLLSSVLNEAVETLGGKVLEDMVSGNWEDEAVVLGLQSEWRDEEITTDELEELWEEERDEIAADNLPFGEDDFDLALKWMKEAGNLKTTEIISGVHLGVPKGCNFTFNSDENGSQQVDWCFGDYLKDVLEDKVEECFSKKWGLERL